MKEGEIVGLLGPNGAGKTTTIQMLLGLTKPSDGIVRFFGHDLESDHEEIMERINYVSAYSEMQSRVTVRENLEVFAGLYDVANSKKKINDIIELLGIAHKMNSLYWYLSSGEKARVNMAKALLNNPELILMDEPTASLDPEIVNTILNLIAKMRKDERVAILYTSHNMSEVSRLCDRVIFLHHGAIIATDTPLGLSRRVGAATLRLTFDKDLRPVTKYLVAEKYEYTMVNPHMVLVSLDEKEIPKVLFGLKNAGVWITDIEIEKPDLEDVFLAVAKGGAAVFDSKTVDVSDITARESILLNPSDGIEKRSLHMRWHRVKTIVIHAWHHLSHSVETWMDIFWFPMIQAFVFGGVAVFFSRLNGGASGVFVVMGIILWYAMETGSYSITVGALWEVWAHSFSSLFVSPLTIEEFVAGHMLFGLFKQIGTVAILSIVGYLTFHFSILSVGVTLPVHLLLLIIFGNAVGMFVLGMIMRLGTRLQSLAWGFIYIIQPVVGVFYPVSVLPPLVQKIAYALPPTYIFESARAAVLTGTPIWSELEIAGALNIIYFILAYLFMKRMWEWARRTGALARMEE